MDFPLPPVGEGLLEVELVRWLVRPGDAISRGQVLAEVMSDKANMEVPSPFTGTITGLAATEGTKVKVGQTLLSYNAVGEGAQQPTQATEKEAAEPRADPTPLAKPQADSNGHSSSAIPQAAPSVRLLARKFNVDLAHVRGSGPNGRILLDDLTPYLTPKPANGTHLVAAAAELSKFDFGVAGTRMKLVGLRRKIAEHMVESKRHIPHYSYIDECDLSDLVHLRAQVRDQLAKTGVKLTYLAFFVKAVARALKELPIVNSSFDEAAGEVILHDKYNVGVAVAAHSGLIVPVVKDADKKDVATIATDIECLSNDAKAGKSKIDDLRGGTFTVTSIGNLGGLISTPIINHPEVGIMGVGKVVKRPVYDAHGALKPADIVYLSFSFDHRVVDGAIGVVFGNAVLRYLHAPALLLLSEKTGG